MTSRGHDLPRVGFRPDIGMFLASLPTLFLAYSTGHAPPTRHLLNPTARSSAPTLLLAGNPALDYVAAFFASAVSTGAVYPVESFKVRQQAGAPFVFGGDESPLNLLKGIELGLAKECPNAAIYLGAYYSLRSAALSLPQLEGRENDAVVLFWVALICGALGDAAGSPLRLPFELVGKNIQAGRGVEGRPFGESLEAALPQEGRAGFLLETWYAVLARDMPFGALQLVFYELAKLVIEPSLGESFVAHLLEGGIAGGMTAIVTTPIDCSITRLMLVDASGASDMRGVDNIVDAAGAVWSEQGPIGFTKGWLTRAAQFGPAAMVFFSAFETLYYVIERL